MGGWRRRPETPVAGRLPKAQQVVGSSRSPGRKERLWPCTAHRCPPGMAEREPGSSNSRGCCWNQEPAGYRVPGLPVVARDSSDASNRLTFTTAVMPDSVRHPMPVSAARAFWFRSWACPPTQPGMMREDAERSCRIPVSVRRTGGARWRSASPFNEMPANVENQSPAGLKNDAGVRMVLTCETR